jgi:spermidine/putrescine transport system substrate-binding protein
MKNSNNKNTGTSTGYTRDYTRIIVIRAFMVLAVVLSIAILLYVPHIARFFRQEKSITVLAWPQELDASELLAFEQETGIKVYVRYFENNEELEAKLLATGGHGVDLIMPSDYAAQNFIKKGLLKKIDKTKLSFVQDLDPRLLGHYFDPNNSYTIPWYWGVFGIGYDKDYFRDLEVSSRPDSGDILRANSSTNSGAISGAVAPVISWQTLFDPAYASAHIAMPNDVRYLVFIAAQHLFGSLDSLDTRDGLDAQRIDRVKQFLIKQKPLVALYTESRSEYLLVSKASSLAVLFSADIAKVMRLFPHIGFAVPQEGSFMLIDSFALSATTKKDELVYQFLNYLYRPEVVKAYVDKFIFFPATTQVQAAFQPDSLALPADSRTKLDFCRNVVPKPVLSDIWVALKS